MSAFYDLSTFDREFGYVCYLNGPGVVLWSISGCFKVPLVASYLFDYMEDAPSDERNQTGKKAPHGRIAPKFKDGTSDDDGDDNDGMIKEKLTAEVIFQRWAARYVNILVMGD